MTLNLYRVRVMRLCQPNQIKPDARYFRFTNPFPLVNRPCWLHFPETNALFTLKKTLTGGVYIIHWHARAPPVTSLCTMCGFAGIRPAWFEVYDCAMRARRRNGMSETTLGREAGGTRFGEPIKNSPGPRGMHKTHKTRSRYISIRQLRDRYAPNNGQTFTKFSRKIAYDFSHYRQLSWKKILKNIDVMYVAPAASSS